MATNYNVIDWGGARPTPYWNDASVYPALVYWSQALVFARAMDVDTTTKAGIDGFSITPVDYIVPWFDVSRSSYGYFWGDVMRITPTVSAYYTCSPAYQDVTAASYFNLSTGATGTPVAKDFFTIGYASRTISGTFDDHVNWRIDYRSISSPATITIATASHEISVTDVWQGGSGEIRANADTYYKIISQSNIGSFSAGTSNITASATTAQKSRAITASLSGGVSYCDISFQPLDTLRTTTRVSSSTSVTGDSFSGAAIYATAVAKQYWSLNAITYTYAAANNEDTVIVDIPSYRDARSVTLTGDDHAHVYATYTDTSGNPNQSSYTTAANHTVTPTNVWQGASCIVSAQADAYYVVATYSGTGSYQDGTSAISASASYGYKTRTVSFSNATFDVTYYNTSGTYTTGTQSSGAVINTWCGGDVTWSAQAISYKTITPSTGTIASADSTTGVSVTPTITLNPRTVTISGDSHTSITAAYTNTSGTSTSITTKSTTAASDSTVWQGSGVDISYTIDSYFTLNTSSNIGYHNDGTSNITAYATAAKATKTITVNKANYWNEAAAAASIEYVPGSGTETSTTISSIATNNLTSETFTAWQGGTATVTIVANTYWTVSGGGTTNPSTSDKTYTLRGYLLPTGLDPSRLSATASYSGGTLSITFTNKTQYTMTAVTVWPSDSYAYVSGDRVTSFTSNSISIAVGRTGTVNITSSLIPYWSDVSQCSIAIRCRVNFVYRTVTGMYVV